MAACKPDAGEVVIDSMRPIAFCLFLAALPALHAQSTFDVVSVKPSDPDSHGMSIGIKPGGVFYGTGATLKALILQAYEIRDFQIAGLPGWADSDRYDIIGKGNTPGPSEEDLGKMSVADRNAFKDALLQKLRALLADRFQLRTHMETRELPMYDLVPAKSGAKISPLTLDRPPKTSLSVRSNGGKVEITGTEISMEALARTLSNQTGRTVTDRSGLKGNFTFKLTFSGDMAADAEGPSIFTALQDELGLKLEAAKGAVQVVVVDSVQRASAN